MPSPNILTAAQGGTWVAALAALAYRVLGRKELAEKRRAEAVELFQELSAAMLLQRLEEEWNALSP